MTTLNLEFVRHAETRDGVVVRGRCPFCQRFVLANGAIVHESPLDITGSWSEKTCGECEQAIREGR